MSKKKNKLLRVIISVALWLFAALWYAPIFWMFSTSLKESTTATSEYPPKWIPDNPTLDNYKRIFAPASGISVSKGIINSLIVSILGTLAGLVVAVPAAYALSRLKFKGKKAVFWSYVAVLAFPGIIFLIPHYFIIYRLGLMDTLAALILPGLGGTFGVFLLRQYMLGIPRELEDAAWIDGCSKLRFLVTIVVPYIKPAMIVLGLMSFLGYWNSFLWPLLVLSSPEKFTLPIALVRFNAGWGDPYRGIGTLMAGAFISVAPVLVIFIVFRKYLMQGIYLGSVGKE
ncbi:MAG: Binding-protein-dependent transport systems inner membrane component [Thermotoga sp. 47_83]|nr:MAG: Binding-protein-dependent transport systems inner membrane component [Thermotoga sp. 47_83]HAA82496.1 carbohydrate ABC transporter permease [Thermotoga petrophila]